MLAAIDVLRAAGWTVPDAAIDTVLGGMMWSRVEVVVRRPAVVVDAGPQRGVDGVLLGNVARELFRRPAMWFFGTTQDKDGRGDAAACSSTPCSSTALPRQQLRDAAGGVGRHCAGAYSAAAGRRSTIRQPHGPPLAAAAEDDLICVTGSFFLAAEVKEQGAGSRSKSLKTTADRFRYTLAWRVQGAVVRSDGSDRSDL